VAPRGGWQKRHQQAASRRGDELRREGARALYTDTVRWYAKTHGLTFQQAASDPNLQMLWRFRRDPHRDTRLAALDELGILERGDDGQWRYSDAFLSWLFEEN
jgi:hypothetical protein